MRNTTLRHVEMDTHGLTDPFSYALASRDRDMMQIVGDALRARRMDIAFHPVVTADTEPCVSFYEGLVRLTDQGGRMLPAAKFMPLVEQTALGRQIDCAALELAFQTLRRRQDIRLSINVSARSLGDGEWRRILDRAMAASPDLAHRLILEISETSAMQLHENVIRFMHEMQPAGICFALDGFGAGYIALRYLRDFFFDLVKIDKGFVRNIDTDPDNQVMTAALINVAQQFEMFVVADGVETLQEAAQLRAMGADCLQGYLFGVPTLDLEAMQRKQA